MVLAKGVESSLVNTLGDIVGNDQMTHLGVEHVVDVEHELGEQPVIGGVQGCVDKIGTDIGLDGQGQKVLGLGVDIEVGRAGGAISLGLKGGLLVVSLIGVCFSG